MTGHKAKLHSRFKSSILLLSLLVLSQVIGCATTSAVSKQQLNTTQQWQRNTSGNYVHVNGRVISEDQYAQIVVKEMNGRLVDIAKRIPKRCEPPRRNK